MHVGHVDSAKMKAALGMKMGNDDWGCTTYAVSMAVAVSSVYFPLSLPRASARPFALLSLDPLDVDPELAPVALDYFAYLLSFEVTSHHHDLIVLADGHASHTVLLLQLLAKGSRH